MGRKRKRKKRRRTKRRRRRNKHSPVHWQPPDLMTIITTNSSPRRNTADSAPQSPQGDPALVPSVSVKTLQSKLHTSSLNYYLCFQTNSLLNFLNIVNFSIVSNKFLNFVFV